MYYIYSSCMTKINSANKRGLISLFRQFAENKWHQNCFEKYNPLCVRNLGNGDIFFDKFRFTYNVGNPPLYKFIECNSAFVLYYYESKTNIDICHGIDAIMNSFAIKIKNAMSSNVTKKLQGILKTLVWP